MLPCFLDTSVMEESETEVSIQHRRLNTGVCVCVCVCVCVFGGWGGGGVGAPQLEEIGRKTGHRTAGETAEHGVSMEGKGSLTNAKDKGRSGTQGTEAFHALLCPCQSSIFQAATQ